MVREGKVMIPVEESDLVLDNPQNLSFKMTQKIWYHNKEEK